MLGPEYRCKLNAGDLGEFINILMFVENDFWRDDDIMDALLDEYFAR